MASGGGDLTLADLQDLCADGDDDVLSSVMPELDPFSQISGIIEEAFSCDNHIEKSEYERATSYGDKAGAAKVVIQSSASSDTKLYQWQSMKRLKQAVGAQSNSRSVAPGVSSCPSSPLQDFWREIALDPSPHDGCEPKAVALIPVAALLPINGVCLSHGAGKATCGSVQQGSVQQRSVQQGPVQQARVVATASLSTGRRGKAVVAQRVHASGIGIRPSATPLSLPLPLPPSPPRVSQEPYGCELLPRAALAMAAPPVHAEMARVQPVPNSSVASPPSVPSAQHLERGTCGSMKRGWTTAENNQILAHVQQHGPKWSVLAALLGRTDDAVRNRYLRLQKKRLASERHGSVQDVKIPRCGDMWTTEEDATIREAVHQHGLQWQLISDLLPGRSSNAVRNRYVRAVSN